MCIRDRDEVARAAVVIDVTPTLALLVASVEGVFDRSGSARWPVQGLSLIHISEPTRPY